MFAGKQPDMVSQVRSGRDWRQKDTNIAQCELTPGSRNICQCLARSTRRIQSCPLLPWRLSLRVELPDNIHIFGQIHISGHDIHISWPNCFLVKIKIILRSEYSYFPDQNIYIFCSHFPVKILILSGRNNKNFQSNYSYFLIEITTFSSQNIDIFWLKRS